MPISSLIYSQKLPFANSLVKFLYAFSAVPHSENAYIFFKIVEECKNNLLRFSLYPYNLAHILKHIPKTFYCGSFAIYEKVHEYTHSLYMNKVT